MKSPLIAALSAGVALTVMAAGASFAQAPAPAAPMAQKPMKRQHDPAEHAQRLRQTLQLTPAQEPALQAFIASHEERRGERMGRREGRDAMANLTTPQRLDLMGQRMIERQQEFAAHAEATKRFYAQLTPAQQKAFDAMHQSRGGKGKGRRGGEGRGPGRG